MMPGAGLYLPHSSHINHEAASHRTEARTVKHKYFERTTMQDKGRNLNSISTPSRTSLALSQRSSDDVTKVFSSLATVFDFADYASSHDKVSSDNEVFVNLLKRVRQDVTEASRLYVSQAVRDMFESWPDKKTWIDAILLDIQRALNDIGVYMETVRVAGDDGGSSGLRRKFEWVLSHQKKLLSKQQNLTVCHQSLTSAIHAMLTVEMREAFNGQDPIYEAPTRPWIPEDERDIFRSPHSRQKWRMSQKNLSLPSITVSEADIDKADARSMDSAPVELPGSTPDDLPHPDNLDLYAPPPKLRSASMDAVRHDTSSTRNPPVPGVMEMAATSSPPRPGPVVAPKPPSNPVNFRRSLDQVRPPISSIQQRARTLLDQTRPRANSEQGQHSSSVAIGLRASVDQARALPTLNEKPIERYNSNASVSVNQAATVPLTTMRQKPRAVNVKKTPVKHASVPARLPSFSDHTSLMDDLSNWVLPASARDSYLSNDSPVSATVSTPSTSITSSPVLTESPTEGFRPAAVLSEARSTPAAPTPPPTSTYIAYSPFHPKRPPPPVPVGVVPPETVGTFSPTVAHRLVQNAHSSGKQIEGNTKVLYTASTSHVPTVGGETGSTLPSRYRTRNHQQKMFSAPQNDPDTEYTASVMHVSAEAASSKIDRPSTAELPVTDTDRTSASTLPIKVQHSEHHEGTVAESTVRVDLSEPIASAAAAAARSIPTATPTVSSPPMTAQARRRAAHARRMQLAFGAEQDKGAEA